MGRFAARGAGFVMPRVTVQISATLSAMSSIA